jgi:hypothetical protein
MEPIATVVERAMIAAPIMTMAAMTVADMESRAREMDGEVASVGRTGSYREGQHQHRRANRYAPGHRIPSCTRARLISGRIDCASGLQHATKCKICTSMLVRDRKSFQEMMLRHFSSSRHDFEATENCRQVATL